MILRFAANLFYEQFAYSANRTR